MPERIKVVVCELQLLEGDQLSHPVGPCCRRVWVDVESSRHGRLCFSCHHPMEKIKSNFFDTEKAPATFAKDLQLTVVGLVW